jgi:hypothetical protein
MKRIITIAILALTGILSVGSAMAQGDAVWVKVPFAFIAGDRLLPAGTYMITSLSADVIHIQRPVFSAGDTLPLRSNEREPSFDKV